MKTANAKKSANNKPTSQSNIDDPSKEGNKNSEVWNEINGKDTSKPPVNNKEVNEEEQGFILTEEDKTHFSNLSRILEKTEVMGKSSKFH